MTAPTTATPGPAAPLTVPPELVPDLGQFVIEDGKPVDGILTEKQMRLLTEPLHSGWAGPAGGQPFVVMANVGVFYTPGGAARCARRPARHRRPPGRYGAAREPDVSGLAAGQGARRGRRDRLESG